MSVTPSMPRRKHIALIAHDNLKADLLDNIPMACNRPQAAAS